MTTLPTPHMNGAESVPPKVLIVDDVQANLVAAQALLEDLECSLVLADSGNEALRQLLKEEFAVLLLDVQMPDMDGYEVAQHARANPATQDVPIVFLTATTNTEQNILRGYGSGAIDYLFKPINPTILRGKVRAFLELYNGRRYLAAANTQLQHANDELRVAYRELQQAQAQLVQAAKMASLGELVAGVAHEINNPLAFVISHATTVGRSLTRLSQERENLTDSGKHHCDRASARVEELQGGLRRIQDLVGKLRTFSRLDEGERKTVSLSESLDSVLTILGHRLRKEIQVVTRFEAPDHLECYPALLNQALLNLVSNAIDALEGAGTISLSTRQEDDTCVITVTDTGHGIPTGLRDRVIEPFFTTKPVGKGTGLGLSITHSIVQKHEGTLLFEDREGGGTKVSIHIPRESDRK